MHDQIPVVLNEIAIRESVQILYACESGSRAWGFASPDSDYDVRFVYVRPVEQYLHLKHLRDVIERPAIDDLDVNGWDIYKACNLLRKSNPPLLEWLGSPIVYLEDSRTASVMREQAKEHYSLRACSEHYLSMARSNWTSYVLDRDQVIRKKYLYVLRPLTCVLWILKNETFPPTAFNDVISGIDLSESILELIDGLLEAKANSREMDEGETISPFNDFITDNLDALPRQVSVLPTRSFPPDQLDGLITDILLQDR